MSTVHRLSRKSSVLLLALLPATFPAVQAGDTWGNVTETQSQVVVQPVGPVLPRAKPMYISGYAGTTYPPVGTRWRAMRSNYQQTGRRDWFQWLKNPR